MTPRWVLLPSLRDNCAILPCLFHSWNAPSTFFDKLSFSKFGHVTVLVAVSLKQTVGTSPHDICTQRHWSHLLLASWVGGLGSVIQVGKAAPHAKKKKKHAWKRLKQNHWFDCRRLINGV